MNNILIVNLILERTLSQLALNKQILERNSNSEMSKWRFFIETTLAAVMAKNLTEEKKLILMSYITENQRLTTLKESEMVLIEKLLDYSNSNEQTAGNRKLSMRETEQKLKTEISHLKDNIDKFIETSKQKFEKCQENEKHLVECFNHDFDRKREESEEEIKSLMGKIELERHRHAERRRELCSTIEKLSENLSSLRANWDTLKSQLSAERDELLHEQNKLKPQIDDLSAKLKERKAIVDEYLNAKMIAEEQQKALMKFSLAIVYIQSWWRGVLARKDYARFKIASAQKTSKSKKQRK